MILRDAHANTVWEKASGTSDNRGLQEQDAKQDGRDYKMS